MYSITKTDTGEIREIFHAEQSNEIPADAVPISDDQAKRLLALGKMDGARHVGGRVVISRAVVEGVALQRAQQEAEFELMSEMNNRAELSLAGLCARDVALLRLLSPSIDQATAAAPLRRALQAIETHDTKLAAIKAAPNQAALDALRASMRSGWPL